MNEEYIPEDVLHNNILYESEKILYFALKRRYIKDLQFIWPIVKAYRKVVNDEQCKRTQNILGEV